ncbi:MAG: sugar ABC transporter permease [Eubacteriales bacterium]|nr:sugar ABC transporter permease [Eubacteriales bacterium]
MKKKGEVKRLLYKNRYLYIMLLFPLIYFILFKYKPMYGVLIAFKNFKVREGILGSDWAGLKYFQQFLEDPDFWNAFKNTVILSLWQIVICFPVPILFALLVNEIRWGKMKGLVQRVCCFPHFVSVVVAISLMMTLVSKDGLVNQIVVTMGGTAKSYMLDSAWFRPLYVISDIWQEMGWSAIIYLAAISGVDTQLYEACEIDGGGRVMKLLHITLPCIAATITIMFILRMGSIMTVSFDKVLLMQNSNTYNTSDVISTFVYRRGLQGMQYSYATAVGLVESVISLFFLGITNFVSSKLSDTSLF